MTGAAVCQCDKHNIFYNPTNGAAVLPLTQSNIDIYGTSPTEGGASKTYRYEYVVKKA